MLKLLEKFLWLVIYLIVLAVALLACRLVALWLDWPAWWTLVLLAGVVFLYFGLRWARMRFRRYREERRASRILEADQAETGEKEQDPELAARMRLTWKTGLSFLSRSRLGRFNYTYALPWFISLGDDDGERRKMVDLASVKGTEIGDAMRDPEFTWHFARKAVWLDVDFALRDDDAGRWPLFLSQLVANRGKAPLGGLALTLDAEFLVAGDEAEVKAKAVLFRSRIDQLIKILGARVPVYLLVNRIDRLYGLRSLVSELPSECLDSPFGAFRTDEKDSPGAFAARSAREASAAIAFAAREHRRESGRDLAFSAGGSALPPGEAAAFQAPDELARLAKPLDVFCREAFSDNPYQLVPILRGVFFGAAEPSGDTVPSLLAAIPSFRGERESSNPTRSWFWTSLLEDWIPEAPTPERSVRQRRHFRAVTVHAGLAGLLVGTLVLCTLMTISFNEGRRILRRAAGRIEEPRTVEALQPFLELTMQTELDRRSWWFPRLGMNEPDHLLDVMHVRYRDAYYDLVMEPNIQRFNTRGMAAVNSNDPHEIGNALLMLMVLRKGLEQRLAGDLEGVGNLSFFLGMMDDLGLSHPVERAQFEMYMQWTDMESWMPRTIDDSLRLERHILNTAMNGNIRKWLPAWIDGMPGQAPVNTASIWLPVNIPSDTYARRTVRAAWTHKGYMQAKEFLDGVVQDEERDTVWVQQRDAALRGYRLEALDAWKVVVYEMWRDYQANIEDEDLSILMRQIASADGPIFRMLALLNEHLLPMFPADDKDPDIAWLRQNIRLLTGATFTAQTTAENPGLLSQLMNKVSGAVTRISSDDNMALLSRNLGLSQGTAQAMALQHWNTLLGGFSAIVTASDMRESSLDMIRAQFRQSASPTLKATDMKVPPPAANGQAQAIPADPFADAKSAAEALTAYLYETTGSNAWSNISPRAAYNYMRYLAVRQAALYIDTVWHESVYNQSLLLTGNDDEKQAQLSAAGGPFDTFMKETAAGLWRKENRSFVNAQWDKLPFMFSQNFLSYADWLVARSQVKKPESIILSFRVNSVSVDSGARERPQSVEFAWNEAGQEQKLVYRNYVVSTAFEWKMDKNAVGSIRIALPSITLTKNFTGYKALGLFVRQFMNGEYAFTPSDFPAQADALRRLGISRIVVRVTMQNQETFMRFMDERYHEPPASIVVTRGPASTTLEESPK